MCDDLVKSEYVKMGALMMRCMITDFPLAVPRVEGFIIRARLGRTGFRFHDLTSSWCVDASENAALTRTRAKMAHPLWIAAAVERLWHI